MENILAISDQLHKLLEDAKSEAESIISAAQQRADEMINQEKAQIETDLVRAQRFSKRTEEEKMRLEANRILEEYKQKAVLLKEVSRSRLSIAVNLVVNEVLPQ